MDGIEKQARNGLIKQHLSYFSVENILDVQEANEACLCSKERSDYFNRKPLELLVVSEQAWP